jgi:hypothetical protein
MFYGDVNAFRNPLSDSFPPGSLAVNKSPGRVPIEFDPFVRKPLAIQILAFVTVLDP